MARFLGLILVLLVVGCFTRVAYAGTAWYATEGEAYAACMSMVASAPANWYDGSCSLVGDDFSGDLNVTCSADSGLVQVDHAVYMGDQPNGAGPGGPQFSWCVARSCVVGPVDDSHYFAPDDVSSVRTDGAGCCVSWQQMNDVHYGGADYSMGNFVRDGSHCAEGYGASGAPAPDDSARDPKPPLACDPGGLSCYNPDNGNACYTTESGEQICRNVGNSGDPGGCSVGATGAVCTGNDNNPAPKPSDPPIPDGQSPDSSASGGKSGGGDTYNFQQNNYSGTDPGGSDSSNPSGNTGNNGSQSNANGNGNSGDNGTDPNGKCANGAVPTASGCSGTFTDGNCDTNTPPACFGDAVLCGNAKENWAVKCATQQMAAASASSSGGYGDPSKALSDAGIPADGGASTDPSTSGLVTSSDLGESGFDASGLGFSRACPANPTFQVLGRSYTLDLTPMCHFATMLGWFVLLCAMLTGLRIVATGKA